MRTAVAGACLALSLGLAGCSQNASDRDSQGPGAEITEPDRSITATQLLETTDWPQDLDLVPLSPTALRQLQNSILGDVEMARTVSDVAAAGFLWELEAVGAILLIGVTDPVVGNMSFVEGLRQSAMDDPSSTRWGALMGWVSSSNRDTLAMVPIGPVVVFVTAKSRSDADRILMPLIEQFVTHSTN
tara:strand:- start:3147 stop:3707 length:561 start_codon:yes stop_codon:yes gene_type:complete